MSGTRAALVVANETYRHADLAQLGAPRADAGVLADLLADPSVGAFDVYVRHDLTAQEMRVVLEAFLAERRPDDLAVLYFSGHGIKALSGALHLAAVDTDPKLLAATSLRGDFVQGLMAESRARRIALFLDCCYGGAFVHGMTVKSGREVHVRDTFDGVDRHAVRVRGRAPPPGGPAGAVAVHPRRRGRPGRPGHGPQQRRVDRAARTLSPRRGHHAAGG